MNSLQQRILEFIDEQLDAINKRPGMWGPDIAVELQILQLLEFRSVVLRPALEASNPRAVLDAYEEFLTQKFPGAPPVPLASLVTTANKAGQLTTILEEFRRNIVMQMLPEDIFRSHDLVLKLWLQKGATVPRASTLSSYYDVFRRVLRAVSRPHGTRGRAKQDIEEAIDFAMSEVSVVSANGAPAHIVLPLDQLQPAPHSDASGAANVKHGIKCIVIVNEWAAERKQSVGELERRLEGRETAQLVAAQTLRLMASTEEAVQTVELGGKFVGRAQPIKIEPTYAERMVEVVKQSSDLIEFEEMGSVRAVDVDQRSMRLGLSKDIHGVNSIQCWIEDVHLVEIASRALVNRDRVRVTGSLYKKRGSPAMVIVRRIQP
jgi:hypothetical protein